MMQFLFNWLKYSIFQTLRLHHSIYFLVLHEIKITKWNILIKILKASRD